MTATQFIENLSAYTSEKEKAKLQKFFKGEDIHTKSLGVAFGTVFKTAMEFQHMALSEIEKLLDSPYYEVRMGAVSIMDYQARDKKTTPTRKKELFDLYISRHHNINNWDFVDRAAPYVVGGYLFDKPRDLLYNLARSKNVWKRRTAIVSTYYFIRKSEVDDTFKIAEILINDKHELIHKAVGSWLREAGKKDPDKLLSFLDTHAASMPRITLRYSIEKLDPDVKKHYMDLKKKKR